MKYCVFAAVMAIVAAASAQQGREEFMKKQAYDEMQRISGLVEIMRTNISDIEQRVGKVENSSETGQLRADIDALKASIAGIRREMGALRDEIVKDLSSRIAAMQPPPAKKAPRPSPKRVYSGPCQEYTVQSGDSLYMISLAFSTTVREIKDMNNLKSDNLQIGQKLLVPKK